MPDPAADLVRLVRERIGRALRQHARVDPAWVRDFVAVHEDTLSGPSRREALKHLRGRTMET